MLPEQENTMKKQVTFELSVLFIRDGDCWVAQCLEYDIAAQGKTLEEVNEALERTFVGQILLDVRRGKEPLQGIPKAPKLYWERFEHGERLKDEDRFSLPENGLPGFMIDALAKDRRILA